jgi:predicted nucleotide-binding protein
LDLAPIILGEQPNRGGTIIEKLEANSTVPFVVVLLTGDDWGVAAKEQKRRVNKLQKRARQNVIFELGYFVAKVGRNRVCTLYASGVEIPSDISGVMFVEYDDGGGWRVELARELSAAGIEVDLNRVVGGGSRTAD